MQELCSPFSALNIFVLGLLVGPPWTHHRSTVRAKAPLAVDLFFRACQAQIDEKQSEQPVAVGREAPVLPPAILLDDQPGPAQAVQRPLHRRAGEPQFDASCVPLTIVIYSNIQMEKVRRGALKKG